MKQRTRFLLVSLFFMCAFLSPFQSLAQTEAEKERLAKNYIPPEQIVSLSFATPFDRAMVIFNELSKKFLGKIIIDPDKRTIPIGVDIESMQWRDAFERILRYNNLWYEETPDYFRIVSLVKGAEGRDKRGEAEGDRSGSANLGGVLLRRCGKGSRKWYQLVYLPRE
jgi:hypothetical protein